LYVELVANCFFQPFNATRINASVISERVNVLEKENGAQGTGKAGFWEEFEVCCTVLHKAIFFKKSSPVGFWVLLGFFGIRFLGFSRFL